MDKDEGQLYTIGEFARRTGLTEKALRLYGGKGLLKPVSVDPQTGYRYYLPDQVDDGRLIAMMRGIGMPLADIQTVIASPSGEQPNLIGRYWYRIERDLDSHRRTVRTLRGVIEEKEHGMSQTSAVIERDRNEGAFAAIRAVAEISDPLEAAAQYQEVMKEAYWENKDMALVTAMAYAGADRLLAAATIAEPAAAFELRCAAKVLMYDLASFSWIGWDEPNLSLTKTDGVAGLAAARTNLTMALELDRGDLALSRAYWMLGGHFLTSGAWRDAVGAYESARDFGRRAGAQAEEELAAAFAAVAALSGGESGASDDLERSIARLKALESGDEFVGQVATVLHVLGLARTD